MADIFYTDATYIDDAPCTRQPTAAPARAHLRLRNWQKFVMCALAATRPAPWLSSLVWLWSDRWPPW